MKTTTTQHQVCTTVIKRETKVLEACTQQLRALSARVEKLNEMLRTIATTSNLGVSNVG